MTFHYALNGQSITREQAIAAFENGIDELDIVHTMECVVETMVACSEDTPASITINNDEVLLVITCSAS